MTIFNLIAFSTHFRLQSLKASGMLRHFDKGKIIEKYLSVFFYNKLLINFITQIFRGSLSKVRNPQCIPQFISVLQKYYKEQTKIQFLQRYKFGNSLNLFGPSTSIV